MFGNPMANPMMAQMMDPRAEQMKQMMLIMGGLGPQVPPQPAGQAMTTHPMGGMNQNPMLPGMLPGGNPFAR